MSIGTHTAEGVCYWCHVGDHTGCPPSGCFCEVCDGAVGWCVHCLKLTTDRAKPCKTYPDGKDYGHDYNYNQNQVQVIQATRLEAEQWAE